MAYKHPPLNPIRVFETAARLMSFTAAAEELNVSQVAVSRQIKVLEDYLGTPLFLRGGFHNSLATRRATRKMHVAWSSDWMMKPRRS